MEAEMVYIEEDLDSFEEWMESGLEALSDYLRKWAEFEVRYGNE